MASYKFVYECVTHPTFEIEAESLPDAYEKLRSRIARGFYPDEEEVESCGIVHLRCEDTELPTDSIEINKMSRSESH